LQPLLVKKTAETI